MKKGERRLLAFIVVVVIGLMAFNAWRQGDVTAQDRELPFYTTASESLSVDGMTLYRKYQCKRCHSLWTVRDIMQTVPAPALDGIGSLRSQSWLYDYLSAEDPQAILASRLKKEFRMPSYRSAPEEERQILSSYLSSLRVKDWYLEEARRAECRKLTGEAC